MTILEAIKRIMNEENEALTSSEIYNKIIDKKLYTFGAVDPKGVVNNTIRRHSIGIDFPTASPVKHFKVYSQNGSMTTYVLKDFNSVIKIITQDATDESESLPEEKIQSGYLIHKKNIQQALLEKVLLSDPAFFEQLVIELLIKMGYGGNDPKAGIATGGPYDGGIDGVIKEDKLGLGKIYIQAKRYAVTKSVGSKEIQQFVGAMKSVQKGIFITTSHFTPTAKKFSIEQQQKSLVLINGEELTELMVNFRVGVSIVKTYETYRIDSDYFSEG